MIPMARGRRAAASLAVVTGLLVAPSPGRAAITGGGGRTVSDCLAVFDAPPVNFPTLRPRHVRCTDGDPACDADATVNGRCDLRVAVCVNSTFDPACTLSGVQAVTVAHALDNGDPRFDPDYQALQARIDDDLDLPSSAPDTCTTPSAVLVFVRGPSARDNCRRGRKKLKVTADSTIIDGQRHEDRNRLKLVCDPAPGGCDPQVLFAGTFDRIQKQVFDQSCAVSACHDSQSQTGGLLLETGASHANLVDATPANPAAAAAGWKRVTVLDPMTGDPATSLLFHKLTGDLGPGFGDRMPFGRRPLKSFLLDLVRLWIEAGAPATGWVAGTD
jgi:hypothetical protein